MKIAKFKSFRKGRNIHLIIATASGQPIAHMAVDCDRKTYDFMPQTIGAFMSAGWSFEQAWIETILPWFAASFAELGLALPRATNADCELEDAEAHMARWKIAGGDAR